MHVIVIGCGKVGSKFAEVMSAEGHDVVIVDNDSKNFKALNSEFNGIVVAGVPIDQDVLKQAGIETADALTAVTPDDNVNIMACQVAREIFKVPRVIARIYNPEREHVFHQFGLETICPTNLTVDVLKSMVLRRRELPVQCINNIGDSLVSLKQESVPEEYVGKKLGMVRVDDNSMVFGIIQDGRFYFANPNTKLGVDDILIIAERLN